jgi:hypothetical protein
VTARATLPEVFRLEISRDELSLITTHISNAASIEIAKRPSLSAVERVIIATKVGHVAGVANRKFIERNSLNALLSLVERLALLGGHPFVEPLRIEE